MDASLQAILSYQFMLFCLAISAITYVITMIVEYSLNAHSIIPQENHVWSHLILPILPVILGSGIALLAKQYPYPAGITNVSGRFVFGLVSGLLATLVWRWVKAVITGKISALQPSEPLVAPSLPVPLPPEHEYIADIKIDKLRKE